MEIVIKTILRQIIARRAGTQDIFKKLVSCDLCGRKSGLKTVAFVLRLSIKEWTLWQSACMVINQVIVQKCSNCLWVILQLIQLICLFFCDDVSIMSGLIWIQTVWFWEGSHYLACNILLRKSLKIIMHGLVKMYVMRWLFCWTTFLYDLALSYIDTLPMGTNCAPLVLVLLWKGHYDVYFW